MKKLLTILLLIMLIISFFQITSMYALYKEEIQGEYSTLLGVWAIKVNDTDISSGGQNLTFEISDSQLEYGQSENIEAGKIAPGGEAYFDIEIDPSKTDVSIIYQIDVDPKAISTITSTDPATEIEINDAIELISVENYFAQEDAEGEISNETTNDTVYQDGNSYTAVIPLSKIAEGYKNYIRLQFRWNNVVVDDVEVNNENDSAIAEVKDSTISIPVQINLKQYTGEVIGNEGS